IPRGSALGLTMQLPTDDRYTFPRDFLLNNLAILMGGRAAEEVVLKRITTGAGNDIERATNLARKMICEWGMSEKLGPLSFGKKDEEIFLGREIQTRRDYSETTAIEIDKEVRSLVTENYERAKQIIRENIKALRAIAEALLEKEVLDAPEIEQLIQASSA
ncbi:MAG TPA: cell division protein FtsH, partial [Nitrospiria bacterium]|nr:cell division protein FtsH [Nitrospiria bacterium]